MPKKKKKNVAAEQDLKATVKKLRSDLVKVETKAGRWKGKAKQHRTELTRARTQVAELEKKLNKGTRTAAEPTPKPATRPVRRRAASSAATPGRVPAGAPAPDESWTVTRLRAEARSKGVTGYSRKTKKQLLATLR